MKEIKAKFRNIKLASKMMLVYLMLVSVVCVVSLIALQISLNIYDEKLYEKSLQELDFFIQKVDDSLNDVEYFTYDIAMSVEIQQQLTKVKTLSHLTAEYNYELYKLRILLLNYIYTHPIIKNIIYTDQYENRTIVGEDCGVIDADIYDNLLQQMHNARGAYVTLSPSEEYPFQLSGRDILKHIDSSMDYLGTYIVTCDVAGMIEKQTGALSAPHSALYVYGPNGVIYQSSDQPIPVELSDLNGQGYRVIRNGGQRYFVCWLQQENDWIYMNIFPYSEIYGQLWWVRVAMITTFVALFIFSAFIMRRMAMMVTRPLQTLTESMKIVETGDFKEAKEILDVEMTNDETGQLTQEFRIMLEKIDILIYENYEKQLLLQEMRYQMLQAQINPHFLNNTLNTVVWMIKANRSEEAKKVIVELGQMLNAALSNETYTRVNQDVEQAQRYITIQEFRYGKRVSFSIKSEGNLGQYILPKMILQPLVENAIYHGVDNALKPCTISVLAIEKEDMIILEVSDDGEGMTEERLESVKNFTAKPKGHGIGLKNIKERLEMSFKDCCKFTIESRFGEGTTVRIQIPKMREEDMNG